MAYQKRGINVDLRRPADRRAFAAGGITSLCVLLVPGVFEALRGRSGLVAGSGSAVDDADGYAYGTAYVPAGAADRLSVYALAIPRAVGAFWSAVARLMFGSGN